MMAAAPPPSLEGVAKIDFAKRFEASAPSDTVVTLHKLCSPCATFIQKSTFLQRLGRKDIKLGAEELGHVGSPRQWKEAYLAGDCHFCAMIWVRAGGYLFDPENPVEPVDVDAPAEVRLTARDPELEYQIMVENENDRTKKFWRKVAPSASM